MTNTKTEFILSGKDIATILDYVLPAVYPDELTTSKFATDNDHLLNCLNFTISNRVLSVAATDASRLSQYRIDLESQTVDDTVFNVPAKAFRDIKKLGKKIIVGACHVNVFDTSVIFSFGAGSVTSDIFTRVDYPRYSELFPHTFKHELEIPYGKSAMTWGSHSPLERFVDHVKDIDKTRGSGGNDPAIVKLGFTRDGLQIGMVHDHFSYNALVPISGIAIDQTIKFNSEFLLDAINHKTTVKMQWNATDKSVVFKYPEISGLRHLLMPLLTTKSY